MELEDCKTVKDCLLWANQEWDGFWDFTTHQPMTPSELKDLEKRLSKDTERFNEFMDHFKECIPARKDLDDYTKDLLVMSATAFRRFNAKDKR